MTPRIFDLLGEQQAGVGGEIQLTDAISKLSEAERILAYHFEGDRHDVGEKLGFIQTTIHYALQYEELKEDLLVYLKDVIDQEARKKSDKTP
ncbi:UTP--glucose-1-phosphate uridylyltransferase [compost metagenome]